MQARGHPRLIAICIILIFFKIQNRSMIGLLMNSIVKSLRTQSIKTQTRLKRLHTILP